VSRQLLILRHAKSDWRAAVSTDFDRPLARRGRKAAAAMGGWLRGHRLIPDLILASPALRARQTVLRLCKAAAIPEATITWAPELYGAEVADLLELLAGCPAGGRRVMVVGHNPGLAHLLRYLAGAALVIPADGKVLPTAALALLAVRGGWADLGPERVRLVSLTRARAVIGGGGG